MISNQYSDYNLKKIIKQDGIMYLLNVEKKIAHVFCSEERDSFIPRSINYDSQEYIVTSICTKAFNTICKIKSVQFAENSEVKIIEPSTFTSNSIRSITLPSSVTKLKDGWYLDTPMLHRIKIDPNNKYYKSYQDQFIFGKSSPEQENFNVLIFSVYNIKTATIPDYIEIFGPYSFSNCNQLSTIDLSSNSNLKIIERDVFNFSSIENFTIPSTVVELKEGWCKNALHLKEVKVDPKNKRYSNFDDKFVIGKSSIDQENFDVLIYCFRNLEKVIIPDFIEVIGPFSFSHFHRLQQVEFSPNSRLRTIEKEAFSFTKISKFIIPNKLVKIGENAFRLCEDLIELEIQPDSKLEMIEKEAFSYTQINNIEIQSSAVKLKDGWSQNMLKLNKVKLNPNNKRYSNNNDDMFIIGKSSINQNNFNTLVFCSQCLNQITIPDFIEIIPPYVFDKFHNLSQIQISPNSKLRIIGRNSFSHSSIEKIFIPPSVIKIDQCAFYDCSKLNTVEIQRNSELQEIGIEAFAHSAIERIFIPLRITQINEGTFYNCFLLISIEFDSNSQLRIIDKEAFAHTAIDSITIPSLVERINDQAFHHCIIQKIEFQLSSNLRIIGKRAFDGNKFHSIILPSHLQIIDEFAFTDCSNLESVEIPENSELRIIGKDAFSSTAIQEINLPSNIVDVTNFLFSYMKKLTKIKVNLNNKYFKSYNNKFVFGKSSENKENFDTLVFSLRNVEEVIIPDFIEIIESQAFEKCENLKTVKIPSNSKLQVIKKKSFNKCKNLQIFEIPENLNLQAIEEGAFSETSIEEITIPLGINDLKGSCFKNIPMLNRIKISSNNHRFALYDDKIIIGKSSNKQSDFDVLVFCAKDVTQIKIPDFIEIIDSFAFSKCNKLKRVEFSKNSRIRMIGKKAFNECSIDKISIPSKISIIDKGAFKLCKNLKYIEIPENSELKSIGVKAFDNCSFEKISIPSSLINIKRKAFSFCKNLQFISFPSNSQLQTIEGLAFICTSIKCFSLPPSIKNIGLSSFDFCDSLQIFEINDYSELAYFDIDYFYGYDKMIIMISNNIINRFKFQ